MRGVCTCVHLYKDLGSSELASYTTSMVWGNGRGIVPRGGEEGLRAAHLQKGAVSDHTTLQEGVCFEAWNCTKNPFICTGVSILLLCIITPTPSKVMQTSTILFVPVTNKERVQLHLHRNLIDRQLPFYLLHLLVPADSCR